MPYLCRKISRAKWHPQSKLAENEVGADAITSCLRTASNTLSVWLCNDDEPDRNEMLLAIASIMQKVETFHVILIPSAELHDARFPLDVTPGNTPIADLVARHRDITNLDMVRLTEIALLIAPRARRDDDVECITTTKGQMIALVKKAVTAGRVEVNNLQKDMRAALQV